MKIFKIGTNSAIWGIRGWSEIKLQRFRQKWHMQSSKFEILNQSKSDQSRKPGL